MTTPRYRSYVLRLRNHAAVLHETNPVTASMMYGAANYMEHLRNQQLEHTMQNHWYNDHRELVLFAETLMELGEVNTAEQMLAFVEKPWKYNEAHDAWVREGRPLGPEDPEGWEPFTDKFFSATLSAHV